MHMCPNITLKQCSIVIDMQPCWINSIRMKECGMDPTLDNQIFKTSKIGPSQPNWLLCIHVVVDNVIIIKCKGHNFLQCIPLNTIAASHHRSISRNAKILENIMHFSSRKCYGLIQQCVFVKGRGCNDKEFSDQPLWYNCKRVHMCITAMMNSVIYNDVISCAHWYAGCV